MPILSRESAPSLTPSQTPQPLTLTSMQRLVLKTQFMCCAQLLLQLYLLCSLDGSHRNCLAPLRQLLQTLQTRLPAQSPAQSPADGPLLLQLAALPLFDARAVAAQLPRAVDFAAVSRACDLIDQLVAKLPPSPPSTKKADFV